VVAIYVASIKRAKFGSHSCTWSPFAKYRLLFKTSDPKANSRAENFIAQLHTRFKSADIDPEAGKRQGQLKFEEERFSGP
jgi:hypothetical protein